MRASALLAIVVSTSIGLGCAYSPSPEMLGTLRSLRTFRQDLVHSPAYANVQLEPIPPVGHLVGVSTQTVLAEMGKPDQCRDAAGDELDLPPEIPCDQRPSIWIYDFYRFATEDTDGKGVVMAGGGPELDLRFDAAGTCTKARWVFTQ